MAQLESTITNLTPATPANLTGAAVVPLDDSTATTVKGTLAQLRTKMFAGSTGYVAADPLMVGGDLGSNASALATSATTPFLWVPSTAGTPTGTPSASMGGAVPLVVDTTNNKLYARVAGAWSGVPISAPPTAANGFKYITTLTASASASLSYTAFDSTTYSTYCIVMEDLFPSAGGNILSLEGSVNGGSSYVGLFSVWSEKNGTVMQNATGAGSTTVTLTDNQGITWASGYSGTIWLNLPVAASHYSQFHWNATGNSNTPNSYKISGGGLYASTTALNALKWTFGGGANVASGTIHIYGLQKA